MSDVEQYSNESRAALVAIADQLVEHLRDHTAYLLGLRGGSAELTDLFEHQEAFRRVARAWDDAVSDHTGTTALGLDDEDDDWDDDDDSDDEDEDEPEIGAVLSIVSRFDLGVVDQDAVLAEGRAAHRRLWPDENEEDAVAAVSRVADALYSIGHEAGEVWFRIPGMEPIAGERVFIAVDDYEPPGEPDGEVDVSPPEGTLVRTEGWSFGY